MSVLSENNVYFRSKSRGVPNDSHEIGPRGGRERRVSEEHAGFGGRHAAAALDRHLGLRDGR